MVYADRGLRLGNTIVHHVGLVDILVNSSTVTSSRVARRNAYCNAVPSYKSCRSMSIRCMYETPDLQTNFC